MRINDFEWDEGNVIHLALGHGLKPEEAEEVFDIKPLFRKNRKGHYVAMGPTMEGRYIVVVFELKAGGAARVITAWDMDRAEIKYWHDHKGKR